MSTRPKHEANQQTTNQVPDAGKTVAPLVSIITPSYNTANYIAHTIESVKKQSYANWEMLIVDDGSTDGSQEIIETFTAIDNRIQLIRLSQNGGPAHARNKGIELAQGRFIAFLDSDDIWLPNKLLQQIEFMLNNNHAFTYSQYSRISEKGEPVGGVVQIPDQVDYHTLLESCVIGCLTAIYDVEQLGKQYMPDILKGQDYALWLKILRSGNRAFGIQENLALYRIRKGSISRNKFKKAAYQWRIYRQAERLSVFQSTYYMLNYAFYGLRRMLS